MKRELKSNYAKIGGSKRTICVCETEPSTNCYEFALKNATIIFNEDSTIEVSGERIEWSFLFERLFLEDMDELPCEKYVKMGYKTIFDLFKGIKKPYVGSGWFKLKQTTPYSCIMNNWFVIL